MYTLLHDHYGFTDDSYVYFVGTISGNEVEWALGSAIYDVNLEPWDLASNDSSDSADSRAAIVGITLTVLGSILIVVALALFIIWSKKSRPSSEYLAA